MSELIDNKNILHTVKPNDRQTPHDGSSESSSPIVTSPFRKIEFHLANIHSTPFTNGDGSFQLELLNPTPTNSDNDHNRVVFDPGNGGSSGKKRDASELDPENSFRITFRRIGAGLENLGNTCFLNSVLQCLTYTQPLAAYLQSGKHQITCRNVGFCALCAIQKHVSRALQSSGKSLAPIDLVLNLRYISQTFRNFRQEDAHEYMVNLLESMHKCCLPSGVPTESPSAYETSLVHNIFGGRLRSQVKCMQCNYCSNKFEPFLDLSLEILKVDSLYKAFAGFTAKEQLDGGSKQYDCQQCKQKVKALKQLTIHEAPNVLTIHLKRFSSFMPGQKIDTKVHFPSTLNLKPFVTGPYDGDLKYTLYGVLVHAGWNTHSGHYYCFVRTSSGMWFLLDDHQVIQVGERIVFEQKAYMLFYFRDRKNYSSKKPVDVIHHKEKATGQNNNTCPIVDTNGTLEDSTQKDISESCFESCPVLVQQKDMVNVPSVLHEPIVSNITEEKGNDVDETMKIDSSSVGDVANVPSTSDGPEMCRPMNDEKEALATTLIEHEEKSTCEDISDSTAVVICSESQTVTGESACVAKEDIAPVNDKKEVLLDTIIEHEEKSTCDDLSVSTAVVICSESQMVTGECAGVAKEDIAPGALPSADGGGYDNQKETVTETVTSTESLILPIMETSLIKKEVIDQRRHKKINSHLKVNSTSMKACSNILVGGFLNNRKKKKHKQKIKSKLPIKSKGMKSGSNIEYKTSDNLANHIENESKDLTSLQCKTNQSICTLLSTDRTVPRWDENESIPSQVRETHDLPSTSIGYIGDEWDNEYDQGKRKKIRGDSCTEFGGRNGFQDIANERLNSHAGKRKKPQKKHSKRFKKSSSRKRRFRR